MVCYSNKYVCCWYPFSTALSVRAFNKRSCFEKNQGDQFARAYRTIIFGKVQHKDREDQVEQQTVTLEQTEQADQANHAAHAGFGLHEEPSPTPEASMNTMGKIIPTLIGTTMVLTIGKAIKNYKKYQKLKII